MPTNLVKEAAMAPPLPCVAELPLKTLWAIPDSCLYACELVCGCMWAPSIFVWIPLWLHRHTHIPMLRQYGV